MTYQRFYRAAATLPLLIPLLVGALGWLTSHAWSSRVVNLDQLPLPLELVAAGAVWLWLSLLFGGLPYLLFMSVALWRLRGRPEDAYFRFSLFAPLIFALLLAVLVVIASLGGTLAASSDLPALASVAALFAGLGATFGYLYVGLVHLLRARLVRQGQQHS